MEFEKLGSYSRIHGVAHRRGAPAVGAPALTRQFILTCDPADYASENDPDDTAHPRHIKNHLTFLDWQKRNLSKAFVQIAVDLELPMPQVEKVNTLYQHFLVDGLFVKVILELYKDYFRVLTLVELEPPADYDGYTPIEISPDDHDRAMAVEGLRARLLQHMVVIKEPNGETAPKDAHNFLRHAFWSQLDEILCIDTIDGLSECKLLLDLRGALFATEDIVGPIEEIPNEADATSTGPFADSDRAQAATSALWQLTGAGGLYKNKEFVCCTLFRESCLYISSIGSHIGSPETDADAHATSFFLATTPRGQRWQIGRLLYRINEIASYRLMAFKNHEEILQTGTAMNQIGSQIERLSNVEFKDEAILNKLGMLKDLKGRIDDLGSTNSAELGYKIERSQYFARRFQQAVNTIDTGRVEGWQPYSDFIERRLQPTFDKMSDVSARFDRLLRLYHAQLAELDSELQRQSSEHLVELQLEVIESESFQHKIESIAFAYYGGSIIFAVLFGLFVYDASTVPVYQWLGLEKDMKDVIEKSLKSFVFLGTSAFAIGWYIFREILHHRKKKEREEKLKDIIGSRSTSGVDTA